MSDEIVNMSKIYSEQYRQELEEKQGNTKKEATNEFKGVGHSKAWVIQRRGSFKGVGHKLGDDVNNNNNNSNNNNLTKTL